MKSFTLTQIIERSISYFEEGLSEVRAPRDNTEGGEQAYFRGEALLLFDVMAYHASTHGWSNQNLLSSDAMEDAERNIVLRADMLRRELYAELERCWSKDQTEYNEWFERTLAKK